MSLNDQLTDLAQALGRVEGKLDALASLPKRVSTLEHFRTRVLTYATAASALAGAAVTLLADSFTSVLAPFFKH